MTPESEDPTVIVAARQRLRLALIASLQYLPARQRAVLLLREVLGFPAAEVASMLSTSTTAVKSTLQSPTSPARLEPDVGPPAARDHRRRPNLPDPARPRVAMPTRATEKNFLSSSQPEVL